jgi:hypothetical protein
MSTKPVSSRRAFLQKVTAVAGGGTALALAATSGYAARPPKVESAPAVKPAKSKGYQRTEHVNAFYQSADF